MRPDEATFRRHLRSGPFQDGVRRGDWSLVSIDWPWAIIAVRAALRDGAPDEYAIRFQLENYAQAAPTGVPWDVESACALPDAFWPAGTIASLVFNPGWRRDALYLAYHRMAQDGHDSWRTQNPAHIWTASSTIVDYLRYLRDVLHSSGYSGVRANAA